MLEKFVAEAYVKLVDVEVQRLNIPERDFTGRVVYRFFNCVYGQSNH